MDSPSDLRMQVRLVGGHQPVRRMWGRIFAFALPLIALSAPLSESQVGGRNLSNSPPRMHYSDSRPMRMPVIDGNDIRFSRLSTAQGLSQTRVERIIEDHQGFMWFETQYGLDRYDGYEFRVFTHTQGESQWA